MPTLPNLTKQSILDMATGEVYSRGHQYYTRDHVLNVTQQGDTIYAEVEGSDDAPYEVVIEHASQETWEVSCTCPYEWGGLCKHSVAVLLYCLHNSDGVPTTPAVSELLTELSREQLIELVAHLAESDRVVGAKVEQWVALGNGVSDMSTTQTAKNTRTPPVLPPIDADALRRSLKVKRSRSRRYEYDYAEGYGYYDGPDLEPVLKTCRLYLDAGDGKTAITALEVVVEVLVDIWTGNGYYGDDSLYEMSDTVGLYLTEALLLADFPRTTRRKWQVKIARWNETLENLDVNGTFTIAEEAAEYGWDAADLEKVLQGQKVPEENDDLFEDEMLTELRLVVLERQQRWQEALNLALYWEDARVAATALWALGQHDEAIEHALQNFHIASQSLVFAKFLQEEGDLAVALRVAERGLTLEGEQYELGKWLIPIAETQGNRALAFTAAKASFRSAIRLDTYDDLRRLAGDDWQTLRPKILHELATKRLGFGQYDNVLRILMQEGKVDEAIAVVEHEMAGSYHAKQILIEEGIEKKRPRWVLKASLEEANAIMDQGKSELYDAAAQWLERVRDAYVALDEDEQWLELIASLIEKHKRKYKLVPLLKQL